MNHPTIHWTHELTELFTPFTKSMSAYSKIYLLIDEQVSSIWLNDLLEQCPELSQANVMELPSGEEGKDWDILKQILDQWVEDAADRQTLVINIGGGATTDLGGFAASIYKRGLDFFHVPTTLMAMVDASLGGKNGINFHGVKNVLGTFEAPNELIICPLFLTSLSDEELLSGLAEMLKHGLIKDVSLWEALISLDEITAETLAPFIQRNIQIKQQIVAEDPFESGERKLLNFGHTMGHAMESYFINKQQPKTHGQCVAWGMVFACLVSQSDGLITEQTSNEIIENVLDIFPLPEDLPEWNDICEIVIHDKKNTDGKLQLTLIKAIGRGLIHQTKTLESLKPVWATFNGLR